MKILIAGGTGFIGRHLCTFLAGKGYELNILTRREMTGVENIHYYRWNIEQGFIDPHAFDGVEALINMTGVNIGEKRWTKNRKEEILKSRIESLELLLKCMLKAGVKIQVLISSSAVGYYGAVTTEHVFQEKDEVGTDFLADVCQRWETEALKCGKVADRIVILRKGVVIGKDGGMYQRLKPLARLGINVSLGSGRQYLPWISIADLIRLYSYILENKEMEGVFNAVADEHITMNEFSKQLLHSFGRKNILPNVPSWMIKFMFGELSGMLLRGSRVSNAKVRATGFRFSCHSISQSL